MALLTHDESSCSRLDYVLLRHGGVVLYHADEVLAEDLAWLRGERYGIHDIDAGDWVVEGGFHEAVANALHFPGYYGRNLDAFSDCIGDVEVPSEGGLAIVFRNVDAVKLREGRFCSFWRFLFSGQWYASLTSRKDQRIG